jgi:hypothetical protein
MKTDSSWLAVTAAVLLAGSGGIALAAQDKYSVQVPNGLALAECRGYEDWPAVAVSQPEGKLLVIVANPTMIDANRGGHPANGKPWPDGSRTTKITWIATQSDEAPFSVNVPGNLASIGCMVKDSARFPDSGGWGYAQFN